MVYNDQHHGPMKPGRLAMDGLDAVYEVNARNDRPLMSHRRQDPLWAQILLGVGWSMVFVAVVILGTMFSWKVVIPWLFVG
jgi:hypothetical protein